jgi:hypothetical protein
MRWLGLLFCLLLAGCGQPRPAGGRGAAATADAPVPPAAKTNKPGLIVTPSTAVTGRIMRVNANARYVVVAYPLGYLPALECRLNVYRAGLKVGEIKITGPTRDTNIAADILAGECRVGDDVRED